MFVAKDKIDLGIEDAKEVDEVSYEMVKGKPFVTLIDVRDVRSNMTHEAREYFATNKKITDIRKAQAIVVNSLHTKILAEFYIKFNKPTNPVKIFRDYNEAEEWLREIRSEWY